MTFPTRAVLAFACTLGALAPAAAQAAPVTVNLRVEGPTKTIFEGPVTTDVRTFHFTGESTQHTCDATSANGGSSPTPLPTRNGAMATASEQHGFAINGPWYATPGGPGYDTVGGEDTRYDPGTNRYLVEYKNWASATVGGCAEGIQPGEEVLYAYADGSEPLLRLTGPATARPGAPIAVKVTNGATNAGIDGAAVGGATSNGAGDASVTLTQRGTQTLKATKAGTIRSNALAVCVSDGADGYCGNPTPTGQVFQPAPAGTPNSATPFVPDLIAPKATIASIKQRQTFSRTKAPKVLKGAVDEAGGVLMVKLRLTRNDDGRCSAYSAKRERFIRRPKCGADEGWWFKVADQPDWEYQLASKLPRGRYVLDVNVIDRAYNRDDARRSGENRVVFTVR